MTGLALAFSFLLVFAAALLRLGGASLVRTLRADALHDAAEGVRGAGRVAALLEDRAILQPSIGVIHAALLVAATIPATWALASLQSGWGLMAALVGLGVVVVLAGDSIPRAWGRAHPGRPAYRLARALAGAIRLGERATDLILDDDDHEEAEDSHQDEEEKELISQVLDFTEAIVREIMVPRTDMVTLPVTARTDEAVGVVLAEGTSRVPISGEDSDDIVGVLYAKDLLQLMDAGAEPGPVTDLMRSPYFVPESKRVSELMREMQRDQVHLAVVVDEFGSTAGLVTIEDIIEELVGEIVDEYDVEEPMAVALGGGAYLLDARMPVDDLADLVGVELPDEDWDTVGGLMLGLAGRVPLEGESFEYDRLVLVAERVQGRRVAQVRVTPR
ncbi:MAG: hemolysin family protein [Actinomycetota bacterium]